MSVCVDLRRPVRVCIRVQAGRQARERGELGHCICVSFHKPAKIGVTVAIVRKIMMMLMVVVTVVKGNKISQSSHVSMNACRHMKQILWGKYEADKQDFIYNL